MMLIIITCMTILVILFIFGGRLEYIRFDFDFVQLGITIPTPTLASFVSTEATSMISGVEESQPATHAFIQGNETKPTGKSCLPVKYLTITSAINYVWSMLMEPVLDG